MEDEGWILSAVPSIDFEMMPALKCVRENYNVIFWDDFERDPESFCDKIKVILVSPQNSKKLTEEFLTKLSNLKVVSTFSTGLSHLDIPLLRKCNLKISRAPGTVTAETTADHGFILMMMAGRRIMENVEAGKEWDSRRHQNHMGQDIHHATLGIVGMGMIGFEVARRAKGFKMKILYHNRHLFVISSSFQSSFLMTLRLWVRYFSGHKTLPIVRRNRICVGCTIAVSNTAINWEDDEEVGATYCSTLEGLLPQVDYLMLTPPLTDKTRGMIGRDQFKLMKPTAFVINVSRGPVIVTEDLIEALKNGTIGGAALDVTDPEALPYNHPLLHMPNVVVTPHVAMLTHGGTAKISGVVADNLRAAMEGTRMPGELHDAKEDGTPKL